jgi:hypothetical protein
VTAVLSQGETGKLIFLSYAISRLTNGLSSIQLRMTYMYIHVISMRETRNLEEFWFQKLIETQDVDGKMKLKSIVR